MFSEYCVIFDMDGVLADTGPIHYESWVKLAEELGKNFTHDFFESTFGQTSPEITRKMMGDDVSEEKIIEYADCKEKYYREMVKDKLNPLPGVNDLLKELHEQSFQLAVGSSGPPKNVELLLKTLQIEEYFDAIITAAEVEKGKPDPDVFLIAAKNVEVIPRNCIVIEDAPVGIQAAEKADMKVIALTTTHPKEQLMGADLIIPDLSHVNSSKIKELLNITSN